MAFARQYSLADEEQLLNWLAEQNAELAEIMRAIRAIPGEEQIAILKHLSDEVAFVGRMVPRRSETYDDKYDQTF